MRRAFALLALTTLSAGGCDRALGLDDGSGQSRTRAARPPRADAAPAATPAAAPAASTAAASVPDAGPPRGRPLTEGERAMLTPIFRDGIDYDRVRVINDRFVIWQADDTYMSPEGNIYAPGSLYEEDFAAADVSPWVQAVFVHEMAHVWQVHSGLKIMSGGVVEYARQLGDYQKAYAYVLAPGKDLLDYGFEQQASILEDYFLMRFHKRSPQRLSGFEGDEAARDAAYAEVLGAFLADARYARRLQPVELDRRHQAEAKKGAAGAAGCDETAAEHQAKHMCGWRFEGKQEKQEKQ